MYGFELRTNENGKVIVHFDNETGVTTYDSLADAMDAIADRINEEKEGKNDDSL